MADPLDPLMVYCVQARVVFTTTARRNQALNAIQSERVQARWGTDIAGAEDALHAGETGFPAVMEVRYVNAADAQAAYGRLETAFTQRAPQPGSWLTLHDCQHDEGGTLCTMTQQRTW